MTTGEEWRDVAGYEGFYQVSSLGRVKRMAGVVVCRNGTRKPVRERVLRPWLVGRGYLCVRLYVDGGAQEYIHRLVCTAFHGPAEGRECNHRNFNILDNRATNLEWLSGRDNKRHAREAGKMNAMTNPNVGRRLSRDAVLSIRAQASGGARAVDLAPQFGVSRATVSRVINRRIWRLPNELSPT